MKEKLHSRYVEKMHCCTERGIPSPLGASKKDNTINFALFSSKAEAVTLALYSLGHQTPFLEIPLHPKINRTGQIWHIAVASLPSSFDYGFKIIPSVVVSDPYGKRLNSNSLWGDGFYADHIILSRWTEPKTFDWQNQTPPQIPFQDLILYEMHVRGLTQDSTSHAQHPGTFLGVVEKIPYLKELGINAIELLPIFEFNEGENVLKNPKTGKKLYNYWGYSTVNFFSPMRRYGTADDFKMMVRELHKNKIEVILDVVYNHTAEGNETGHTYSFRGIDNGVYYILGPHGEYLNFTGCGNTFNCNHPVTAELILDSLRYWVSEMHVDGFRFDLASILTRDIDGKPLQNPPVIEAISKDPVLANTKLIAEAWDAAGLYQVGSFPAYGKWAEWNGKFRDVVRRFIKGTDAQAGAFAGALSGSQDLYGQGRKPYHSINFVTAHDGFSLKDLVSYNQKHNEQNGEQSRDGTNDNESWNCGQEGPSANAKILSLRSRQMRNFHTALMVSLGTPMLLMGDEYGHTRSGNNNSWSHDGILNWFLWGELLKEKDFARFYKAMISFRKNHPLLRRTEFLQKDDVEWHGHLPSQPDWSPKSRFVACTFKDNVKQEHLYIAFNAEPGRPAVYLPPPPPHKNWFRVVDTALVPPFDFLDEPEKFPPIKATYRMEAYSTLIAQAN
jgi:isoamylase